MKLTPVDLAQAATGFDVAQSHYDFTTQRRTGLETALATTFRATQTHNGAGKPNDNDND